MICRNTKLAGGAAFSGGLPWVADPSRFCRGAGSHAPGVAVGLCLRRLAQPPAITKIAIDRKTATRNPFERRPVTNSTPQPHSKLSWTLRDAQNLESKSDNAVGMHTF